MRYRILFQNYTSKFGFDYRYKFIKYIKRVAYVNDENLYKSLFFDKKSSQFSFSIYFNKAHFKSRYIYVKKYSKIYMTFSINDEYALQFEKLLSHIGENDVYEDGLMFKSYIELKNPDFQSNQVFVEMLSPLLVRDGDTGKYYSVGDDDFNDKIVECLKKELKTEEVKIVPVKNRKTVVKFKEKHIPGTLGQFLLIADKEVIKTFYDLGIGIKKEDGFGLFQILK